MSGLEWALFDKPVIVEGDWKTIGERLPGRQCTCYRHQEEVDMIRALDMAVIDVRDWSRAVTWYTEQLGLQVVYREDEHRWCDLSAPEGGALLALRGLDEVDIDVRNRCVLELRTENLSETVEELRARGVQFLRDIGEEVRANGQWYRWTNVADPEGNVLRLYEWV